MNLFVNQNLFSLRFLFHRRKVEAASLRIIQNMQYGHEFWNVKHGLKGKSCIEIPKIVKVIDPLRSYAFQYSTLPAVVGCENRCPIAKDLM